MCMPSSLLRASNVFFALTYLIIDVQRSLYLLIKCAEVISLPLVLLLLYSGGGAERQGRGNEAEEGPEQEHRKEG